MTQLEEFADKLASKPLKTRKIVTREPFRDLCVPIDDVDALVDDSHLRCTVRERFVARDETRTRHWPLMGSHKSVLCGLSSLFHLVCPPALGDTDKSREMRVWKATEFVLFDPDAKASLIEAIVRAWIRSGSRVRELHHVRDAVAHACGGATIDAALLERLVHAAFVVTPYERRQCTDRRSYSSSITSLLDALRQALGEHEGGELKQ